MTKLFDTAHRFPLYEVSGSSREMGRQHGEQARIRIAGFLGWLCELLRCDEKELERRARRFLPLFDEVCPHIIEETVGLGEGAGISFELALACQLRGEAAASINGGCTTFVIGRRGTITGEVLIGQTSDMASEVIPYAYVLHAYPDNRPELIMWTFGGMLGYHGLNSMGIAHFANSLGGGPAWKHGLSHYPLKRMILEQRTMADVRGLVDRYPVCSNGNYVLCDGEGRIADVEITTQGAVWVDGEQEGFLAHSNHFLCHPFACEANDRASLADSFPRLDRARSLIKARLGHLTLADMQQILSDHDNFPLSICRHPHDGPSYDVIPNTGRTVAAIIAEPESGRIHIASGNPCEKPFVEYRLSSGA